MKIAAIEPSCAAPRTQAFGGWTPRLLFVLALAATAWLGVVGTVRAQLPGSLDISFNSGTSGLNNAVRSVVLQSDGKVVIGGEFSSISGVTRYYIARLNADGSLDTSFDPGIGASNYITSIALQSDGKVVIGGLFTSVNGVGRNRIARLNANGSLDTSFNPGTGANNSINSLALQGDGKILVAGGFSSLNGTRRNYIARLNADGSVDSSFDPGSGMDSTVNALALQNDGKMIIAGLFTTVNGVGRRGLARLNTDGSLDPGLNPGTGPNSIISSVAVQSGDGKVIIGGDFVTFNGVACNHVVRLNADGSVDTTFNLGTGANLGVSSVLLQSDGKVVIGGSFNSVNSVARVGIARLNTDGSVDMTFTPSPGTNNYVRSLVVQSSNGKMIFGGYFTTFNGAGRTFVAQCNTDGSLDTSFNPSTGANSYVKSVAVQSDSKTVIGGNFTGINNSARNRVARLNADGSVDPTFNPGTGPNDTVNSAAVHSDGKVVITGYFTSVSGVGRKGLARLNADGSLDTTFDPGTGPNSPINSVAVRRDGKILIGGGFSNLNGTGRNRIAQLNVDGSVDTSFNPGTGANNTINAVFLQGDGKVVIGGDFTFVNGVGRNRVARLNADGSVDTSFNPGAGPNASVLTLAAQGDGKVVIGGYFILVSGVARNSVARLNADGSLDTTFNPGTGPDNSVVSLTMQPDAEVIVAGYFTSFNGVGRNRLARLNTDGSLDILFNPGSGLDDSAYSVAVQNSDGKVVVGGPFALADGLNFARVARFFGGDMPAVNDGDGADTLRTKSAVIRAGVNPERFVTNVFFEYGLTSSYGNTTATQIIDAGGLPVAISAALSELTLATPYHYRAVATNYLGTTYGPDVVFTTLTLAQEWRQQYFGATGNTGNAADGADPDGDGIGNLLERALGLNPTQADTAGLPVTARDTTTGRLMLTAAKGAYASDFTFIAEASVDLVNWTASGVTVLADTATTFQARDDGPADHQRFLRLRVTAPQASSLTGLSRARRSPAVSGDNAIGE